MQLGPFAQEFRLDIKFFFKKSTSKKKKRKKEGYIWLLGNDTASEQKYAKIKVGLCLPNGGKLSSPWIQKDDEAGSSKWLVYPRGVGEGSGGSEGKDLWGFR